MLRRVVVVLASGCADVEMVGIRKLMIV